VKGQILAIRTEPGTIRHNVRTPDVYMVPREDGRLVVGATVEEMGFNRDLTVGGIFELLRGAWRAIPGLYELPLHETWCGFRPGSRDNAPILGETEIPGLFLATGHYRNGILNTPVTAFHMATAILDGKTPDVLAPFSPRRFTE
jgi:glycine oxidase